MSAVPLSLVRFPPSGLCQNRKWFMAALSFSATVVLYNTVGGWVTRHDQHAWLSGMGGGATEERRAMEELEKRNREEHGCIPALQASQVPTWMQDQRHAAPCMPLPEGCA